VNKRSNTSPTPNMTTAPGSGTLAPPAPKSP